MPHWHLEIPLLGPEAARSPKVPREVSRQQGILQSTDALFMFLMVLHHFARHKKLYNKQAVQSTTATNIAHRGKQDPG